MILLWEKARLKKLIVVLIKRIQKQLWIKAMPLEIPSVLFQPLLQNRRSLLKELKENMKWKGQNVLFSKKSTFLMKRLKGTRWWKELDAKTVICDSHNFMIGYNLLIHINLKQYILYTWARSTEEMFEQNMY